MYLKINQHKKIIDAIEFNKQISWEKKTKENFTIVIFQMAS